jgi:DNA (cytosine-5)-methyltransferase 1
MRLLGMAAVALAVAATPAFGAASAVVAASMVPVTSAMPFLVATDCSGLGSPVLVLQRMGLPYRYIWASDTEKACRTMLRRHCAPENLYRCIYSRPCQELPKPDLYVVGFPCQPFSGAGKRQGFAGPGGTIFFEVLETIRLMRPKAFLLENVDGLCSAGQGTYLDSIAESLQQLGGYNIHWKVLNTKDHGIPHNRSRIFFVGIRQDSDDGSFCFPSPAPPADIREFLDQRVGRPSYADLPPTTQSTARHNVLQLLSDIEAKGADPFFEPWIFECDGSLPYMKAFLGVSPCITRSRYQGHWLSNMGRRMSQQEALRLQGFDDSFENVVTERQFRQMLGNGMSLNVLERIFCRLLPAAGLSGTLEDPLSREAFPWKRRRME